MSRDTEIELTKGQRLAGNIIAGAYIVVVGIFLLIVGLGLINGLTLKNTALPSILLTLGLVFLTTAFIQKNTVSLWLSFAFLVPSAVSFVANFTSATYAQLYPLYIAIPAIASFFTMFMSGSYRDHLRVIIFFGLIAGIFALDSVFDLGWVIVIPALVVFIGLTIVYAAVKLSKKEKDNDEE